MYNKERTERVSSIAWNWKQTQQRRAFPPSVAWNLGTTNATEEVLRFSLPSREIEYRQRDGRENMKLGRENVTETVSPSVA
jgi:hypothetical protein